MNKSVGQWKFATKQPFSTNFPVPYRNLHTASMIVKIIERLYCPTEGISEDDFEECFPLLLFVELLIYETDDQLESSQSNQERSAYTSPWDTKKALIIALLKELNLNNSFIMNRLENIEEFCQLETKLVTTENLNYDDFIRASELRSCDFQLLHTILVQMVGKPYRQEIFDIWLPREVLMEFVDDINYYKKDVAAGKYNTYWIFERLYGKEQAPHYLKAEIDRYSHLFQEKLKQVSEPEQEIFRKQFTRFLERFPHVASAELIRKKALGEI